MEMVAVILIWVILIVWLVNRNSNNKVVFHGKGKVPEKYGSSESAVFSGKSWGSDFYTVNTRSHGKLLFGIACTPEKLEWKEGQPYGFMRYMNTNFIVHVPERKYSDMREFMRYYQMQTRQEKMRQEIKKVKENKKLPIIEFVKKHTGRNIESLYYSMELSHKQAVRHYATYKITPPTAPTYTRGVVSGSLADNVSTIANAQKKADYDRRVDEHSKILGEAYKCKDNFEQKADEIEDIIMEIPEHQECLAIHREICSELRTELNKVGL